MSQFGRSSLLSSRSCIRYEVGFKQEEMERVKLVQPMEEGAVRARKCPIFTGAEGVEGLLYVWTRFERAAQYLQYDTGLELFDNWILCLAATAENQWDTLTELIPENERTGVRFQQEINAFVLQYCDSNARDTVIDYLGSSECVKKHDEDVRTHGERIRTICRLANELPGNVPLLDDDAKKKILFKTYPEDWQLNFESARNYATSSEQDIMAFMAIEKAKADKREIIKKRNISGGRGRGPQMQRGRGGGRFFAQSGGYNYNNGGRPHYNNGNGSGFPSRYQGNPNFGRYNGGRSYNGGSRFQGRGNNRGGRGFQRGGYQGQSYQRGRAPYNPSGYAPNEQGRAPHVQQYHFQGRGPPARAAMPAPESHHFNHVGWGDAPHSDEHYGYQPYHYENEEGYNEQFFDEGKQDEGYGW